MHYEGADVPVDESPAQYAARVRSIQNYHMNVSAEGYVDIAYNWLVSPIGDVYEGRGWDAKSGAQASGNSSSLAICYLGGPNTVFTDRAQNATNWLIAQRPMTVFPHKHWIATSCPGPNVEAWINLGRPGGNACQCPAPGASAPAPPTTSRPTIRRGSSGAAVRDLQARLNRVTGSALAVDGSFGPATDHAVRNFQTFFHLGTDGIVGPKTWGLLDGLFALKG